MNGKISVNYIYANCLLSFGKSGIGLQLEPLNILVGPNGSGKSNFLELFRLIQASSNDISEPIVKGGGLEHWYYKGETSNKAQRFNPKWSSLKTIMPVDDIAFAGAFGDTFVEHNLTLGMFGARPNVIREEVYRLTLNPNDHDEKSVKIRNEYYDKEIFYSYSVNKGATIQQYGITDEKGNFNQFRHVKRDISTQDIDSGQSILSQRVDPDAYPFLYEVDFSYRRMFFYTDSVLGRASLARLPQDAALDSKFLFPDASNLALVLNDLQNQPPVMKTIIEKLKLFYERAENIITRVQGGTVQIFFQEEGLTQTVPASRLSDGTLRYLCLLVILCHPSPPPLICIEEPELGMHPDVLPTIAELLIEASQRTQLIITTHSDLLVSAIGAKHPEAIVVCEKGDNGTTMKRLEPEKMQEWLTRYSLGDLWLKGEIGGTRW